MRIGNEILLNTSGETAEILVDHEDDMQVIIRCPNCGQPTMYGYTRMISGYVGCDNAYKNADCFFGDLAPRVVEAKKKGDPDYGTLQMYSVKREGKEEFAFLMDLCEDIKDALEGRRQEI